MKPSISGLSRVLLFFFLFGLAGCNGPDGDADQKSSVKAGHNASGWDKYLSEHTDHDVSKKTRIRVRFVKPVIDDNQVGKEAGAFMKIEPDVSGSVTFTNTREILFIPDQSLKSGEEYSVTVKGDGLKGIPSSLGDYRFGIEVIKQNFEVVVDSLDVDSANEDYFILKGGITTSDVESADNITPIITIRHNNKTLPITWQHASDGLQHEFIVQKIPRGGESGELILSWNGQALAVANSGERRFPIPAKGVFNISHMRVVQGERRYVEVSFTEPLDSNQNLKGLIRITDTPFTTAIDGGSIKIYPQKEITGELSVTVEPGVKSSKGRKLNDAVTQSVVFAQEKPQVRFAGKGVILPANEKLTVPVEALNVHSLQVAAFQVFDNNLGQFLQNNKLDGNEELYRVGRFLWRKTINLNNPQANQWNRYALDLSELLRSHPGSLFRLTLSINRGNSIYTCSEEENGVPLPEAMPLNNHEDISREDDSGWDYAEDYYEGEGDDWAERNNPCKDAYYANSTETSASRNFLASNIGLIAKRGEAGELHVVSTDLREAQPLSGVTLHVMNFQDQEVAQAVSDSSGFARIPLRDTPFYLVAENGDERGYLKLNKGSALPTSHFDVGGQKIRKGLKGTIYGERGVWRPGDALHLTFVLQDELDTIPANHPVTMQLFNPRGVMVQSVTNSEPVGDFYAFTMQTSEDAPTGNWQVKAILGGSEFSRTVKIETVVPNRLKMELDFGDEILYYSDDKRTGTLKAQWLHGAKASDLKADVALRLSVRPTTFERFADHNFDDPARKFYSERQALFDGKLDKDGVAEFKEAISVDQDTAPGMLTATFFSRVFEQGGAFSSSSQSMIYHPFERYVGIKAPKGDEMRSMLLTDTDHEISVATLNDKGEPVAVDEVEMNLYKIEWKWWWDKSGESLARYADAAHYDPVATGTVSTADNGMGKWGFQVKYPEWGRYLLRACDKGSGHCSGKIIYIDWPGWAGRASEEGGSGANVLNFFADKKAYQVGEEALIQLPEAVKGRALLTVENGSGIVEQRWLELAEGERKFKLMITEAMAPNVYVSVTMLQPHRNKPNDRPIRLYGITPLKVNNPKSHLAPQIQVADEIRPNATAAVEVSEREGRAMTYTLALVDEGLLGLTNFKTPDLHSIFYRKEALGVTTWDLYDFVAGAYGGELETLLSLGGSDDADDMDGKKKRRFPPVVRFLGPFQLNAGERQQHEVDIPNYVGALRVMVVAGELGAYGLAEKEVVVREPLSMLATLPRVLRADETLQVPVSLFAYDASIKSVELSVEANEYFELSGNGKVNVAFDGPGEKIGFIGLKVKPKLGKGHLLFHARAGKFKSSVEVNIDILSPNPITSRYQRKALNPGDNWQTRITPHGIDGTNSTVLEISTAPPIDLDRRLGYLIRYPHGCIEQTTSSVFPQLSLPKLAKLDKGMRDKVERNIEAGIKRLRGFQTSDGGFSYWPGYRNADDWGSNYAGHFLIEAQKAGYFVPPEMLADWLGYQQRTAQSWVTGGERSTLGQTYRLFTLALAGKPEMGAMNRLREQGKLDSVSARMLASTYQLSGLTSAATALMGESPLQLSDYVVEGNTYGSRLRDSAIALDALVLTGKVEQAKELADEIAKDLASDKWFSTQSLAYSLMALARFVGDDPKAEPYRYTYRIGNGDSVSSENSTPYLSEKLNVISMDGEAFSLTNDSKRVLYATLLSDGAAPAGSEQESMNQLTLRVTYSDLAGKPIDISRLNQGTDLKVKLQVTNNSQRKLGNLALSHIVPAGWEIHNPRFTGDAEAASELDYQDIRDDRVYNYFSLNAGESKSFTVLLNAAYLGRFYQPAIGVEAMYDATRHARIKGQWIEVVKGK